MHTSTPIRTTQASRRFQGLAAAESFPQKLYTRLQSLGQTSSAQPRSIVQPRFILLLRYVVLATLAFFFFTAPVSFREVSHASQPPAPRA